MTAATILRPEGRDHRAEGQRYWTIPQCESLIGREVEIRDWYVTFRATVEGIAEISQRGFVSALTLTYQSRHGETVTRPFSLNVTREIAL